MTLTIVTAVVTSIITSLAVWRFYINWQFYQSTAGYRLNDVLEASLLLIDEQFTANNDDEAILALFTSKYRNSLGPILPILHCVFSRNQYAESNVYPRIDSEAKGNTWGLFDQHVRPVISDINNNSFIGWLPGVPNVERLLSLQRLCFQLEKVIACVDHEYKINEDTSLKSESPHIGEILDLSDKFSAQQDSVALVELRQNCKELEGRWREWLQLVKNYNTSKKQ